MFAPGTAALQSQVLAEPGQNNAAGSDSRAGVSSSRGNLGELPVPSLDESSPGRRPFVSIVMPVRNEGRFMARSLDSVLRQTYPKDRFEVIVADGMSTDETREIIRAFSREHPVRLVDNPAHIVSTGLNLALRQPKGDIVIRIDGHCEIAEDYVERCVQHLARPGVDVVGGPLTTLGQTPVADAIAVAMSSRFGVGNSAFRTGQLKAFVDTVAFPALTRELLMRAGPFDEELVRNQDDEYNYRLRKMGANILLADDVRARYYSRSSFSRLWRQYFQYGYWKVRVMQKHTRQMRPRQFAPPIFVGTLSLLLFLSLVSAQARLAASILVGTYLIANLSATLLTAGRAGWRSVTLLPPAFAILHLSYGAGFLVGLGRFWNRWGDRATRMPAAACDNPQHSDLL
jgi:glycosyltransferase involved in cell wall biosynthesis